MKTVIIYDSMYGNTEKLAKAIAGAFPNGEVEIIRAGESNYVPEDTGLFIIGSPTQGGRPTKPVQDFMDKMSLTSNVNLKVAAFDTRLANKLVVIFGYAADKIANNFKKNGITLIIPPEGFIVKGAKGPLKEGELERAAGWGKELADKMKNV